MRIRLRCMNKACRFEFIRPETIVDLDPEAYGREKRCPECGCDATTLADMQPQPGLWWSDGHGLIRQLPRRVAGDELRYEVANNRVVNVLPEGAVPLVLAPDRAQVLQTARDEYSMVWENSGKRTGDHDRALRHAVDVAVFGAPPMPDPGDLQEWMVEGPGLLPMKYSSFSMALYRMGRTDSVTVQTRLRNSVEEDWGSWLPADKRTGAPLCQCTTPVLIHDGPVAFTDGRLCTSCLCREGAQAADRRRKMQREGQRWR